MDAHDFWPSGTFDNSATGCREVWQDGKLMRYVRRECVGGDSSWREVRKAWGAYPDHPVNQMRMQA